MTSDELTADIDAMHAAANGDPDKLPGLITINADEWCTQLYEIEHSIRTLDDGIRHREIRVAISSTFTSAILTRAEAGERGAPYREQP